VSKNSLEKLGNPNFSELEFLRTEMENFESWKKFGWRSLQDFGTL